VPAGYYTDPTWGPVWVVLTWGTVQLATEAWMQQNREEEYALLTDRYVAANPGVVNLPLLQQDIAKLNAA
jgi:hypothetical protein